MEIKSWSQAMMKVQVLLGRPVLRMPPFRNLVRLDPPNFSNKWILWENSHLSICQLKTRIDVVLFSSKQLKICMVRRNKIFLWQIHVCMVSSYCLISYMTVTVIQGFLISYFFIYFLVVCNDLSWSFSNWILKSNEARNKKKQVTTNI